MKVGLFLVPLIAEVEALRAIGERADREPGIHSIWIPEPHLLAFPDDDSDFPYTEDGKMPESYSAEGELDGLLALAFLAGITNRVRIGIGVCIVAQRHPIYVAKEVTTLDQLSHGRFDFGVGIGWMEKEFRAVEASFPDRAPRTSENLKVMRALWSREPDGALDAPGVPPGAIQEPYPVQQPHPPIHFGGNGRRALERVAAQGQGWLPWDVSPEETREGIAKMEGLLGERDRARAEIQVTVATTTPIEQIDVEAYAAAGVDQLLPVIPPVRSADEVDELFARLEATPLLSASVSGTNR